MEDIIKVAQLPVIVERLQQIKEATKEKVRQASSLVCTEETVKEVKKARAELNSELKDWESKRIEVKKLIMTPYEKFEAIYKDCISETYKAADKELKSKIDAVESELKEQKSADVKSYFNEYLNYIHKDLDFISFETSGINVTMSASLKSLKEQAKSYIDKVADDLEIIKTFNDSEEILIEYKKNFNVSQSLQIVTTRKKQIEEEKKRKEESETASTVKTEEKKPEETFLEAPKVEKPAKKDMNELLTLSFKVTAKRSELILLKRFLDDGGYEYE